MPGLVGIFSTEEEAHAPFDTMLEKMCHRPFLQVDRFALQGLSLARVHPGAFTYDQAVSDPSGRYRLFMDGKIFDDGAEREGEVFSPPSDPELCLRSFLKHGFGFARRLNGTFLLVIYDLKEERLHIVNDRCGIAPLNYAVTPEGLVFASEVAPLLQFPSVERTIDDTAVADFFAFGRLFGDKTFLKSVSVMPAGSILSYGDGVVTVERYWEYQFQPDHSLSEREHARRLALVFRRAVERQMRLPLRYGILLSGGLDSRAIVGAMPEPARHAVTAFPHGQHGCEEIPIAERVAETAGMGCRPTEVTPELLLDDLGECVRMTDGLDPCMVNFVPKLSCALRDEGMDVVFHGLGLDSLLGGTALVGDLDALTGLSDDAVDDYLYRAWRFFTDDEFAALFTPDYYETVKAFPRRSFNEVAAGISDRNPLNRSDHFKLETHFRRLAAMGIVIWRTGVEMATPGTDAPFLDLVLRIPPEYRKGHRIYRKFLKVLTPELAAIPYNKTLVPPSAPLAVWRIGMLIRDGSDLLKARVNSKLGAPIFDLPRRNVIDFQRWFVEDERWMRTFSELLLSDDAASRSYLNAETIRGYLDPARSWKPGDWVKLVYIVSFELYLRSLRS